MRHTFKEEWLIQEGRWQCQRHVEGCIHQREWPITMVEMVYDTQNNAPPFLHLLLEVYIVKKGESTHTTEEQ